MQRYGGLAHPKMGKSFQCHCHVWANIEGEGMRSNIFEILLWKLVWTSHRYIGKKTVLPTNEHLQFHWLALWSRENSETQIIIYSWQTTLQKWAHTNQASKAIYFQQTYFWLTSFRLSQGPRQLEVTTWLSFRQWSIWLSWFCFLDLFTLTWKKLCFFISAQVRLSGILKCSPKTMVWWQGQLLQSMRTWVRFQLFPSVFLPPGLWWKSKTLTTCSSNIVLCQRFKCETKYTLGVLN